MEKNKKRTGKAVWTLLALAAAVWLMADVFPGHFAHRVALGKMGTLIRAGNFEEARIYAQRQQAFDYSESTFLRCYCDFYPLYLEGLKEQAAEKYWEYLPWPSVRPDWIDWDAVEEVRALKNRLKAEAEEKARLEKERQEREKAEKARLAQEEKERRIAEEKRRAQESEAPYLGMSYYYIDQTKLGKHSYDLSSRETLLASIPGGWNLLDHGIGRYLNIYYFDRDGKPYMDVYTADWKVDQITRYTDDALYVTCTDSRVARFRMENRKHGPRTRAFTAGPNAGTSGGGPVSYITLPERIVYFSAEQPEDDGFIYEYMDSFWDGRAGYFTITAESGAEPGKYIPSGYSSSSSGDPYNAGDYATWEDFYDDNREDFYDIEEAADYYDAHH